jgi:UV radiation resistance-associated gene protein
LLDLRNIYPITFLRGEDRFLIRDLCIPLDIHSGAVTEEEISAALGFLCHLISMVSKYMSVQLRHRVFCNSSRSAIQEEGGAIYPLFLARVVEREELDRGLQLLRRNVECIMKARDIDFQPREHILVNVKKLFDIMIDRME